MHFVCDFYSAPNDNIFDYSLEDIERKLKEAEAREEALLRRITEKDKALNKMR